jgi:hypothetical protein
LYVPENSPIKDGRIGAVREARNAGEVKKWVVVREWVRSWVQFPGVQAEQTGQGGVKRFTRLLLALLLRPPVTLGHPHSPSHSLSRPEIQWILCFLVDRARKVGASGQARLEECMARQEVEVLI